MLKIFVFIKRLIAALTINLVPSSLLYLPSLGLDTMRRWDRNSTNLLGFAIEELENQLKFHSGGTLMHNYTLDKDRRGINEFRISTLRHYHSLKMDLF